MPCADVNHLRRIASNSILSGLPDVLTTPDGVRLVGWVVEYFNLVRIHSFISCLSESHVKLNRPHVASTSPPCSFIDCTQIITVRFEASKVKGMRFKGLSLRNDISCIAHKAFKRGDYLWLHLLDSTDLASLDFALNCIKPKSKPHPSIPCLSTSNYGFTNPDFNPELKLFEFAPPFKDRNYAFLTRGMHPVFFSSQSSVLEALIVKMFLHLTQAETMDENFDVRLMRRAAGLGVAQICLMRGFTLTKTGYNLDTPQLKREGKLHKVQLRYKLQTESVILQVQPCRAVRMYGN
ncbi:hypothetical protein C8F04DRAFT_1338881 [Mycena alexandri]|uniref:Uncharacterized protein n=1 Tax=Mycena alexandri TaxID=1745969 RepID=A0AAD6SZA9_9AGAR|nr:hypothetical protein C8F04DRAFT_1338881 [Mycena alexandri]